MKTKQKRQLLAVFALISVIVTSLLFWVRSGLNRSIQMQDREESPLEVPRTLLMGPRAVVKNTGASSARDRVPASLQEPPIDIKNLEELRKRGWEVLRASVKSIEGLEVKVGKVKAEDGFAEVTFEQYIGDVPVVPPQGTATIHFSGDGLLREKYIFLVEKFKFKNRPDPSHKGSGRLAIWMNGEEATYVYESYEKGIQTLVDADTGEVLLRRDRRQY